MNIPKFYQSSYETAMKEGMSEEDFIKEMEACQRQLEAWKVSPSNNRLGLDDTQDKAPQQ